MDVNNTEKILQSIKNHVEKENIRITQHGHSEMIEESISVDELLQTLQESQVIENYPDHKRGACCLLYGATLYGRHLHVVCTTSLEVLVVITVYEPKMPYWLNPFERNKK